MPTVTAFTPKFQVLDSSGNPGNAWKIYTYAPGTTTPQASYTDSTGNTANANPVIADSRGEINLWLDVSLLYKIVVKDSSDVTIWTVDNFNTTYNSIQKIIVDAKGDLISATAADTPARLAVGANYTFLRALSSESTGLAWLGAFPSENISTGGTLTAAQMNKALISSTDSATYTLPDLTAALDGSMGILMSNGGLTNGITLAADASDSILDPTTGTVGSIVLVGTGESVAVVGCFANNRWYVLALERTAQRAILQFNSGTATLTAGGTAYFGNSTATTTEVAHDCRVPFKCIVSNLHTTAQAVQTGGQTTTYTIRKNASYTTLTCVNSTGRNASDTTNSVSFAQGDLISIKAVTSASATATTHTATIELRRVT